MKSNVYLCGPISDHEHTYRDAFSAAKAELERRGYNVTSPADLDGDQFPGWLEAMNRDLPHLANADMVAVLPGWDKSEGCRLEVYIALRLRKPVVDALTTKPLSLYAARPTFYAMDRYEDREYSGMSIEV